MDIGYPFRNIHISIVMGGGGALKKLNRLFDSCLRFGSKIEMLGLVVVNLLDHSVMFISVYSNVSICFSCPQ